MRELHKMMARDTTASHTKWVAASVGGTPSVRGTVSPATMDMVPNRIGQTKSKYLGRKGSPGAKESLRTLTGQLITKSSVKRFQKKWLTKKCNTSELINTSVADMLLELRFAATECLYPKGRENFKVVDCFFFRYRMTVYQEESIYEMHFKNIIEKNEQEMPQSLLEAEHVPPMQKKQKKAADLNDTTGTGTDLKESVAPTVKACIPAMPPLAPKAPPMGSVRNNLEKVAKMPAMSAAAKAPTIDVMRMRKNLEMMASTLDQSGNNIRLEVKAELERDIQILLKKVVNLPSSASS